MLRRAASRLAIGGASGAASGGGWVHPGVAPEALPKGFGLPAGYDDPLFAQTKTDLAGSGWFQSRGVPDTTLGWDPTMNAPEAHMSLWADMAPHFLSTPRACVAEVVSWSTSTLHLPTWVALALAAVTFRTALYPLWMMQQQYAEWSIVPEMRTIMNEASKIKTLAAEQVKQGEQRVVNAIISAEEEAEKDKIMAGVRRYKTYPFMAAVFLTHLATTGSVPMIPTHELATGGGLWFADLTVPDPYYVLPFVNSLQYVVRHYALKYRMGTSGSGTPQMLATIGMAVSFGFSFLFLTAAPAAVSLIWAVNSLVQIGFTISLVSPSLRTRVELPPMGSFTARVYRKLSKTDLALATSGDIREDMRRSRGNREGLSPRGALVL